MAQLKYQLQQAFERSQAPLGFAPDPASMERFLALCHRRRYPGKTAIIRPGDPANTLYYVIDGSVTVCSEDEQGRELILAYISRGQFIGEMGLFVEQAQRESMVRTRTPCEMAEISYERLFQLMEGPLREECPKILFSIGVAADQPSAAHLAPGQPHGLHGRHQPDFAHAAGPVPGAGRDDPSRTAPRSASRVRKSAASSVARARWSAACSSNSRSSA